VTCPTLAAFSVATTGLNSLKGHMSCARKDAVAKRGEWGTNAWQLVRADLTILMIARKRCPDLAIEAATGMLKETRRTIESLL
jgi:hypothetical protein